MQDHKSLRLNIVDRMQRTIDKTVSKSKKYNSKKEFTEIAINSHVSEILELLSGYKDLVYFAKNLDDDIEWLDIQVSDSNINTKLIEDKNLSCQLYAELDENTEGILARASSISSLTKSDIARACLLKELYENSREILQEPSYRRVSKRWGAVRVDIEMSNRVLIDNLKHFIDTDFVKKNIEQEDQMHNLRDITHHYQEFKGTKGYETMTEYESGQKVIEILERIENKVNVSE